MSNRENDEIRAMIYAKAMSMNPYRVDRKSNKSWNVSSYHKTMTEAIEMTTFIKSLGWEARIREFV